MLTSFDFLITLLLWVNGIGGKTSADCDVKVSTHLQMASTQLQLSPSESKHQQTEQDLPDQQRVKEHHDIQQQQQQQPRLGQKLDRNHKKQHHKDKQKQQQQKQQRLNQSSNTHQDDPTRNNTNINNREHFRLSHEGRLYRHLERRYRRAGNTARPVFNASQTVKIEFGLALIQILDFDETNQVLTSNVWKRYRWFDEILTWNPEDFGGISDVRLRSGMIWTPDIVLYNNADEQVKQHEELIAVYYTGLVRWIPPAIYRSACSLDMHNFPFDEQTCHLKFGSWTYDGKKLDLVFYDSLVDFDTREFIDSSEWEILNTSAAYNQRRYPCCANETYPDITFYLTVKRRTAFYVYVLILPSVLLSFLTLVLFWIPPQRPDRTSLGMSLFSSFFVLLLILVQSSPPTSASISLLGVYYCINMILIALSTMVSTIVINMTHYLKMKSVPRCMKWLFLDFLAVLLCAKSELLFREDCQQDVILESVVRHAKNGYTTTRSRPVSPGGHVGSHVIATPVSAAAASALDSGVRGHRKRLQAGKTDSYAQRNLQWRTIAQVIDRVFFVIYAVAIALSFAFVFPR